MSDPGWYNRIKNRLLLCHQRMADWLICYLTCDVDPIPEVPLSNFKQLQKIIQPGDILLVEGRSRVSRVISTITRSPWTHAALYLGGSSDIKDKTLLEAVKKHHAYSETEPLLIESRMEMGVVLLPLKTYQNEHVRICRPKGITSEATLSVLHYALCQLGTPYDHRQIFDLARFLFPWFLLPRRWRSSLFCYQLGEPSKMTCSLLIANAHMIIHFPILPYIRKLSDEKIEFIRRNVRLFTPRDFDYSPYFKLLKCPPIEFDENKPFTSIKWNEHYISNDGEGLVPFHSNQGTNSHDKF